MAECPRPLLPVVFLLCAISFQACERAIRSDSRIARAAATTNLGTRTATESIRTLDGKVNFEMRLVPGGAFEVVRDGRKKSVEIKSFWIATTEVTWDLYDIWWKRLDEQPRPGTDESRPDLGFEAFFGGAPYRELGHDGWPAGSVHPNAAQLFCQWLSAKAGRRYRLPTTYEWEWACRAGVGPVRGKVNLDELKREAWIRENAEDAPHPVARLRANALGIYDMLGNVAEWAVSDDGSLVARGGSFESSAESVNCHSSEPFGRVLQRNDLAVPNSRWWLSDGKHIGFRVVREND